MNIETKLGTFELVNDEKVQRVIEGSTNSRGELVGGLGEDAIANNPIQVLAMYDKAGGLIRGKQGARVKTGSFYDFKKRTPREEPVVRYQFNINGRHIELAADEELPLEVQASLAEGEAEQNDDEEILESPRAKRAKKATK